MHYLTHERLCVRSAIKLCATIFWWAVLVLRRKHVILDYCSRQRKDAHEKIEKTSCSRVRMDGMPERKPPSSWWANTHLNFVSLCLFNFFVSLYRFLPASNNKKSIYICTVPNTVVLSFALICRDAANKLSYTHPYMTSEYAAWACVPQLHRND